MKLQIAFDLVDLEKSLVIAKDVQAFADIIQVGSLLIYKHGVQAVEAFKEALPEKTILVDAKIVNEGRQATSLFAGANAEWISVMAGTAKHVIHQATKEAHSKGKKILLDLHDARSLGQSALEAKSLGGDGLLFHTPLEESKEALMENWDIVQGNTSLPIFISARVPRERIPELIELNPAGLVVSSAITEAANPKEEAEYFYNLLKKVEKPAEENEQPAESQ